MTIKERTFLNDALDDIKGKIRRTKSTNMKRKWRGKANSIRATLKNHR